MKYQVIKTVNHCGEKANTLVDSTDDLNQANKTRMDHFDESDRIVYKDATCFCDAEIRVVE